ncbi:maturation and nuclear export of 40S ribosomal subunits interacting protein [Zygosaccharomyces mellis]|uniref:Maturation and nuclear export of 40S ribosomal subunits interacting protein n=1 Tax=Zygosaccharomyces mellis TaxID=42258 RepID=A0A4C2DZ85_9SACH|nr:maturation and nuclear export of 40S ribosomal subunits interacting protein [Zygosaccharomyces mellis]
MLSFNEIKSSAKLLTASEDRRNYNKVVQLVNDLEVNDETLKDESRLRFLLVALLQIFKKMFSRGDLRSKDALAEWCRQAYETFKSKLLQTISGLPVETSLGLDSVDIYMQLIEQESVYFAAREEAPYFPNKSLGCLIQALWSSNIRSSGTKEAISGQSENPLLMEFVEKYYKNYGDIQYYFQSEFNYLLEHGQYVTEGNMSKWLATVNHDSSCTNEGVDLEVFVPNPPQVVENESKFRTLLEKNWLLMVHGELSLAQYKTTLLILHRRVIPHIHTPTKFMDFLTDAYDLQSRDANAGMVPVLALNGLFELMLRFNLEYPNFYQKLYGLLTANLMHAKYRARFFRLMDTFLASTHISAHLVASFIKRLSRLTLNAPPGAVVSVIPFVYNLLKKHPSCMVMLHNPAYITNPLMTAEQTEHVKSLRENYVDPFDEKESNPEKTRAMESSLWELASLTEHYHPNVATLAKIFSQPFRKVNYNMEDFLDWSYDSLLAAETSRRLKVLPTLEYENFGKLFGEENTEGIAFLTGVDW